MREKRIGKQEAIIHDNLGAIASRLEAITISLKVIAEKDYRIIDW